MDRLVTDLDAANGRVERVRAIVAAQQEQIERLRARGVSTEAAEQLLEALKRTLDRLEALRLDLMRGTFQF